MTEAELRYAIDQAERSGATEMDLSGKGFAEVPPALGRLTKLTRLNLGKNRLTTLPPEIGRLVKLKELNLSANRLTELPPQLGELSQLCKLDVSGNPLTALPPELGRLGRLTELTLQAGAGSDGTRGAVAVIAALGALFTLGPVAALWAGGLAYGAGGGGGDGGHSLTWPPAEVLAGGTRAILAFLKDALEGSRPRWQAKVVFAGQGGVGKTSLARVLAGGSFQAAEETTTGMETRLLTLSHPTRKEVQLQLKVWDFGGQEVYHATHQFYLTDQSVFLLVWNARTGAEQCRLDYWLDMIGARAPGSPVLLVATHLDQCVGELPLDELRRRHPGIVGLFCVSSKTGTGLEELKDALRRAAAGLPSMGQPWPNLWVNAAEAVGRRPENWLSPEQLRPLLATHRVAQDKADVLIRWLHQAGDLLYFGDDPELREVVLLKPGWVSQVIGKALASPELGPSGGVLEPEHLRRLWPDVEPAMRDHLLRLMERFDLSYPLADRRQAALIVGRLPQDAPDYRAAWEAPLKQGPCAELGLVYRLRTLPAGIPGYFLAREHRFDTGMRWRNGALLADKDRRHLGLVVASPEEGRVRLTVRGPHPQTFFALLRDGLESALGRYPKLKVRRFVPCPGHGGAACPFEFPYEALLRRLEAGKAAAECGEAGEDVPRGRLLFAWGERTRDVTFARLEQLLEERGRDEARRYEQLLQAVRQRSAGWPAGLELLREAEARSGATAARREADLLASVERLAARLGGEQAERLAGLVAPLREQVAASTAGQDRVLAEIRDLGALVQRQFATLLKLEQAQAEVACPSVFVLRPLGTRGWLRVLQGQKMELQLFCEQPGCWHPAGGPYEVSRPAEWLRQLAPHLRLLCRLLRFVLPVAGPWLPEGWDQYRARLQESVRNMEELLPALGDAPGAAPEAARAEGATLRVLRRLLEEVDPAQHWSGLTRVLTPEQDLLWLCKHHAAEVRR